MKVFGIKCKKCGDFIYSRAVHDFHSCTCEACSIDGGQNDYFRIIGARDDWEIVKEVEIKAKDKKELYEDWNKGKNKYGWIKGDKVGTSNS